MAQTNEKSTNKKKIVTSALAVGLAAAMLLGGGTFAYLQDNTEEVKNEFTANQVTVDLAESTGNQYNIVPGTSQAKDPKVTVDNSLDAYVYVEVTENIKDLVTYEIADGWTKLDGYENVYYREIAADAETKEFYVLKDNTVTYDAALVNDNMLDADGNLRTDLALSFKAYAIQKAPFNDPADAYYMSTADTVGTASDFVNALSTAAEGDVIVLTNDLNVNDLKAEDGTQLYDVNNRLVLDTPNVTIDLNGNKMTVYNHTLTITGDNVTVKNGTIIATPSSSSQTYGSYAVAVGGKNVTLDGLTTVGGISVNGYDENADEDIIKYPDASANIINCNIEDTNYYAVCAQGDGDAYISNSTLNCEKGKATFWIENENSSITYEASTVTITGDLPLAMGTVQPVAQ